MVEFQKHKWKYTTIGLMAILAAGFSFPQAFAAPIDSVLNIVKDIQAKVNDSTNGLAAIKSAVSSPNDGLPAVNSQLEEIQDTLAAQDSGEMKAINYKTRVDAGNSSFYWVFGNSNSEKLYKGHMHIAWCCTPPDEILISCYNAGQFSYIYVLSKDPNGQLGGNTGTSFDFQCENSAISISNWDNNNDLAFGASVVYREIPAQFVDGTEQ